MSDIELSDVEDAKYDSDKEDNDNDNVIILKKKNSTIDDSDNEDNDDNDINEDSDIEPDINEDYDNDTDVNVRIQKVADILALLENKSIDELKELRNEMIEVCRYNQQHFNNKVDLRYKLSAGDYNPQHSVIKILANIFYDIK